MHFQVDSLMDLPNLVLWATRRSKIYSTCICRAARNKTQQVLALTYLATNKEMNCASRLSTISSFSTISSYVKSSMTSEGKSNFTKVILIVNPCKTHHLKFLCLTSYQILAFVLRYYKEVRKVISERDYVLMWNLMPTDYDEAVALIPSLADTPQESVVKIINFLNEKRGASQRTWRVKKAFDSSTDRQLPW